MASRPTLRRLLARRKLSQGELARRMGSAPETICRIINGGPASRGYLERMALFLNADPVKVYAAYLEGLKK